MENSKVKNVIAVVKNPIGVIGLFLVLVEAIAALVVVKSTLPYSLNLILVLFIVLFPVIVLLVFYLLVTKHHEKLYSPSDYKDEKYFVSTYNSATQTEEIIEVSSQGETDTVSAKEGMSLDDINVIKESLNTIVSMQKSLAEKNKRYEDTAIVEHVEKTINERLDAYVMEKDFEHKIKITYLAGSRQFVKDLNKKGYSAEIYFGVAGKDTQLRKNLEHEAIWLGKNVPVHTAIEIIKMAKSKFTYLKYIDLSPDNAPEYVHDEIYIGGATSTAIEDKLKKMTNKDFTKFYECKSMEEMHEFIRCFNMS